MGFFSIDFCSGCTDPVLLRSHVHEGACRLFTRRFQFSRSRVWPTAAFTPPKGSLLKKGISFANSLFFHRRDAQFPLHRSRPRLGLHFKWEQLWGGVPVHTVWLGPDDTPQGS